MLVALHGTSVIKMFIIFVLNYYIAKCFGGSMLNPLLTWIFNGAVLFANEIYEGYRFASLHPTLALLVCNYEIGFRICLSWLFSG